MAEIRASGRNFGGQNRQGTSVTDDAVSAWFIREVLPFEPNLMHYLQHNWRNKSDLADLRQETYARVLEAAQEKIPENPKNFLLVCARNLMIDRMRREQVVPMESFGDFDATGIATPAPEPDRQLIEREDIKRLEAALVQLPPRMREAIALAYFQGLSRTEIAARMGVTQQAASKFIAKGAVALSRILYGASADREPRS
jgi:RNA polymerase sigma-70 factor (ECF subfamily)